MNITLVQYPIKTNPLYSIFLLKLLCDFSSFPCHSNWFSHLKVIQSQFIPGYKQEPQERDPFSLSPLSPPSPPSPPSLFLSFFSSVKLNLEVKVRVTQSCPTLWDPMDYTVHGILQAKVLEWVAFPSSRGSSQPRDQTQVSRIEGRFFTS